MKQYLDQINGIAEDIYNELYKRVDATPNKFVDLQNLDCTKDNIYCVPEVDAMPTNIIGLAIFTDVLCAYFGFEPQFTGKKKAYTADEMLEGDFWVMINSKSDNFVGNMMNIAKTIDQYLPPTTEKNPLPHYNSIECAKKREDKFGDFTLTILRSKYRIHPFHVEDDFNNLTVEGYTVYDEHDRYITTVKELDEL